MIIDTLFQICICFRTFFFLFSSTTTSSRAFVLCSELCHSHYTAANFSPPLLNLSLFMRVTHSRLRLNSAPFFFSSLSDDIQYVGEYGFNHPLLLFYFCFVLVCRENARLPVSFAYNEKKNHLHFPNPFTFFLSSSIVIKYVASVLLISMHVLRFSLSFSRVFSVTFPLHLHWSAKSRSVHSLVKRVSQFLKRKAQKKKNGLMVWSMHARIIRSLI